MALKRTEMKIEGAEKVNGGSEEIQSYLSLNSFRRFGIMKCRSLKTGAA